MSITVVSALTGEELTKVDLPRNASVWRLKIQVEKLTGKSAFHLQFVQEGGDFEPCCAEDFQTLEEALGCVETVRLAMLASQSRLQPGGHASENDGVGSGFGDFQQSALPYDALERDYLPASGTPDSALGMMWRYAHLQKAH